jgi:diguanylate cyclase (GGDEF)-like protein
MSMLHDAYAWLVVAVARARRACRFKLWQCLACMCMVGHAQAMPLIVDFHDNESEVVLGRNAQILQDADKRLNLPMLLSDAHGWDNYHAETFNFGFDRSSWWVRVRLHNADAHEVTRVLDLGSALQDEIDVYVVRANGAAVQHVATGDRRSFDTRPVATRVPSMPIQFAPDESLDVYVKLATHDGLHEAMALKLWQPRAYAQSMQTENLFFGLYYGALATVLAYNLFLFISTRQRGFGLYAMYVSAFLLWSFTFRGYALQYLWPDSPAFNNQILPIAAAACYGTFAIFNISYLDTRRNAPSWAHRLLVVLAIGNALCVMPALFDGYALSFAASIPLGVTLMGVTLASGIIMVRNGSRPARYFLISFSVLAMGVMLYYLRLLGAVPSNPLTENFLQIGSAVEVLLLAFGLADQMNQLKADKLRAEQDALAAKTALADELESLVHRRTRALEATNRRLRESAMTDDLTGAYNLRYFNMVLDAELARHARCGAPVALCLFDIDHFRYYNDCHGHPAGDLVLQRLAHAARERLHRGGDQLFRIGEDKFAMLINVDPIASSLLEFVECVRAEMEALGLPHASPSEEEAGEGGDGVRGMVTASFGVMAMTRSAPSMSAQELYSAADHLLKQAKQQGRNVVRGRISAGSAERPGLKVVRARQEE